MKLRLTGNGIVKVYLQVTKTMLVTVLYNKVTFTNDIKEYYRWSIYLIKVFSTLLQLLFYIIKFHVVSSLHLSQFVTFLFTNLFILSNGVNGGATA